MNPLAHSVADRPSANGELLMRVSIDEVSIGKRYRKDMGDLDALAQSIAELGLLQPIGVVPKERPNRLEIVFGERRFRACRDILGMADVDVRVLDIGDLIKKERDENEVRKDFTASERVSIAKAIEQKLKNQERRGRPSKDIPQNFAELTGQESRDVAAKSAGFGNRETYRQAKTVTELGVPELVEAMDSNVISINAASRLAKRKPEEQKRAVHDQSFYDEVTRKAEAETEALKDDDIRISEVVTAFETIAKCQIAIPKFMAKAHPGELLVVDQSLPRVHAFIQAMEGRRNGKTAI
ncbi:MAG: ParB N-terminal domain-containing protein [Hyphomicrobiales bacterium]